MNLMHFKHTRFRNLDSKLSTVSDLEQYRLMSITEDPISNRQQHLDVMCFPVLFPNGNLGSSILAKREFQPVSTSSLGS